MEGISLFKRGTYSREGALIQINTVYIQIAPEI